MQIILADSSLLLCTHFGKILLHARVRNHLGNAVDPLVRADHVVNAQGLFLHADAEAAILDGIGIAVVDGVVSGPVRIGQNQRGLHGVFRGGVGAFVLRRPLRHGAPYVSAALIRQREIAGFTVQHKAERLVFQNIACLVFLRGVILHGKARSAAGAAGKQAQKQKQGQQRT